MVDVKKSLAGLALCALAACGGGGDGGSSGQQPVASALRVTNVAPARLEQDVVAASNPAAGFNITADVTGDLTRLNGETVFVLIEDARGQFEVAGTFISPTGPGNSIGLRVKSTLGQSGPVEGTLRVNVCLDAACTRPLGNSPVLLPYRLNVLPGIRLANSGPVVLEVPFGAPNLLPGYVASVDQPVTLFVPANVGSLSTIPPFEQEWVSAAGAPGGDALATLSAGTLVPGQTAAGTLSFIRRPVGTYVSYLKITSLLNGLGRAESVQEVR